MQQIINFIIRNKTFLLFLFLFSIALLFTIQSHTYHKSKFINSANTLTGGVYNSVNQASQYTNLKSQNRLLVEENNILKSKLYNSTTKQYPIDQLEYINKYSSQTAHVIKNSYASSDNILLIDKGTNDSIVQDLGVVTSNGILGIIDRVSNNYATVLSILNTTSKISAQLKKTNHFGSLIWNGKSSKEIQLIDVEKIAPVQIGDTIITSGRSSIFPKGIPVGTVKNFNLDTAENYYEINITLFNDMSNIEHVYIIKNNNTVEINNLLNVNNE